MAYSSIPTFETPNGAYSDKVQFDLEDLLKHRKSNCTFTGFDINTAFFSENYSEFEIIRSEKETLKKKTNKILDVFKKSIIINFTKKSVSFDEPTLPKKIPTYFFKSKGTGLKNELKPVNYSFYEQTLNTIVPLKVQKLKTKPVLRSSELISLVESRGRSNLVSNLEVQFLESLEKKYLFSIFTKSNLRFGFGSFNFVDNYFEQSPESLMLREANDSVKLSGFVGIENTSLAFKQDYNKKYSRYVETWFEDFNYSHQINKNFKNATTGVRLNRKSTIF